MMKTLPLLFIALCLGATQSYAQIKITPITYKNHEHFITTTIGYPVDGLFTIDGKKEPIIQLNPDGTGIYQSEDLSKKNINWGIECSEEGIPIFKEGFNSASYSFWYKPSDEENWITTQFSIHFNKRKMFIMGERVKEYVDYNDLPKPKSK
ncbi:hypothetical protein SGQ44_17375 [Flavobacterium sp. Fl-77]|uniref:Uncharacterized protein n=1 Tax=Flavobacterium flavipigmentatum TaxID=2893884 RepID=A0AAJ2SCA8_9FLAO|nr:MULTISPECIES: hypothetical protein [unclassified Flavobacterium]MDX6183979.1 hypothetical protein [Flavobacterium sp. Fl-33]MDX6187532.1 hypothetical protein [Flavobacterium sp. Fl-77]UFH38425.1 hypothetical protein LNP22_17060 [Flavobacterium sp. F-70]